MIEHAVFGTDFSEGWEGARRFVAPLAKLLGVSRLTLTHVAFAHPLTADAELRKEFEPQLEALAKELAAECALAVDTHIHQGTPAHALLATAHELEADGLIVAGRGHSRLHDMFIGSVALDLARLTDRPLVILPTDSAPASFDGPIMLATDGSHSCAAAEARFHELVERGHKGVVLTVETHEGEPEQAEISAHARELTADLDNASATVVKGNAREAIGEQARQQRASLIMVGQRGHNPLTELLLGSTAEAVIRAAASPVLVVPAGAPPG